MSKKSKQKQILDWQGLIDAVSRDLELTKVRAKQIESALITFKDRKRRRDPFPGEEEIRRAGRKTCA